MTSAGCEQSYWQDGWLDFAKKTPSPNFNARPQGVEPELVVLHSISLPPGVYGNGYIEALFLNELVWSEHPYFMAICGLQVSSHFVIDRHGGLTQYVSCADRAWHAGRSAWQGREECNDWSIGIELEGLEGELFEEKQYRTLVHLLNNICSMYPIRWVAGHEHIAPQRKYDPGAGFDWGRMVGQVRGLDQNAFPPLINAGSHNSTSAD